jgi:hypothetical protein
MNLVSRTSAYSEVNIQEKDKKIILQYLDVYSISRLSLYHRHMHTSRTSIAKIP